MKPAYLLLFFITLCALPVAVAEPPFAGDATAATTGLQVQRSLIDFYGINQDHEVHYHVFNLSNGVLMSDTLISCDFWMVNSEGLLVYYEDNMTADDGYDFMISLAGTNFSVLGDYVQHVYCENVEGNLGGFTTAKIVVTLDGEEKYKGDSTAGISTIIFIMSITALLLLLGFWVDNREENILNYIGARAYWTLAAASMLFNVGIMSDVASYAGFYINSELWAYMHIIGWAMYLLMLWLVLGTILNSFKLVLKKKRGEREA